MKKERIKKSTIVLVTIKVMATVNVLNIYIVYKRIAYIFAHSQTDHVTDFMENIKMSMFCLFRAMHTSVGILHIVCHLFLYFFMVKAFQILFFKKQIRNVFEYISLDFLARSSLSLSNVTMVFVAFTVFFTAVTTCCMYFLYCCLLLMCWNKNNKIRVWIP